MKRAIKRLSVIVMSLVIVFSVAVFVAACGDKNNDNPPANEQTEPVKIKDGEAISLTVEEECKSIIIADYVTVNGNNVTVASSAPDIATATLADGVVTVNAVKKGTATVTVTCGNVEIAFAVTVSEKSVAPPATVEYTVSLNGEESTVEENGIFTLPESFTPEDEDFEFVRWNIVGDHEISGNKVTVLGDLTITAETRRKEAEKIKDGNSLTFTVGDAAKTVTVAEYITTHGNDVSANSDTPAVATATLTDGVVTVNAVKKGTATITVTCGNVEITFAVTVGDATQITTPSVKNAEVVISETHDLYSGDYTVDLAENIELANLITGYMVNSESVYGTTYSISGDTYTQTPTLVTLNVTATYNGGSVNYVYKVNIIDTTAYRIRNGGFDDGLDGWQKIGQIGNISEATAYWTNDNDGNGYSYNADGKFFSAYEPSDRFESNIGALISSPFKVSQNGIITFKLGGAKHDIFVDVVDTKNGEIIARYGNSAWAETTDNLKSGCTLIAYKATLPASAVEKTVYIRVIDMAQSDYGVLFCDSFVTYYESAPESGIDAVDITDRPATVYELYNGGFEQDMKGWVISGGDIGAVTADKGCFNNGDPNDTTKAYGQEDSKLFSFWSWNEAENKEYNREGNLGTLTSNMFVLKPNKFVSFKFGGGKNRNVFIELVNAASGTVIAIFRNDNVVEGNESALVSYSYAPTTAELSADALCYFRVVDNAVTDWGCFTADAFKVNLDSAPTDSALAVNCLSEYKSLINGSFEDGNLNGWTAPAGNALGAVVNTEKSESWYQTNESTKDGNWLFTFYIPNWGDSNNKEKGTGVIRSSAFILDKNGIVSFRFGAAHNREVYINVYTTGGRLLATFRNNAFTEATVMVQYYYQFDNAEELSCYFEIVDNAEKDYGCIVMDDFRVNLEAAPNGAILGSSLTKAERDQANN